MKIRYGLPLFSLTGDDHVIASALVSVYTEAISSRRALITEHERIKSFYLTQALLTAIVEDALTPTIENQEIFQVHSQDPAIDKELDILQQMFSFDQIVNDIVQDLLLYGEYTLRLVTEEGRGVCEIIDDCDPSKITAFYEQGFPKYFLQMTDRDIEVFPPYYFAHFVFGRHRLRIKLSNEMRYMGDYLDAFGQPYPTYARVGRPLLYGVLYKMKELMVLEQLIPASQLNRVLSGSLLTVQVPPSMSPQDAFEASRRYENMINSKIGIDRTSGDISVTDILTTAGKIRVLPQIGEKGQLTNIQEAKENRTLDDLLNTVQDVRSVICGSMGFP